MDSPSPPPPPPPPPPQGGGALSMQTSQGGSLMQSNCSRLLNRVLDC